MSRGKQQILYNYLPGRTFDFQGIATIARVEKVRGTPRVDLNQEILVRKVAEEARAWDPEFRPAFRDDLFHHPERFVLIDPKSVVSEMFPKVFWCDNRRCGQVVDFSRREGLPEPMCRVCRTGKLVQMRFVRVHRCGELQPLTPPSCSQCHTSNQMALDTRNSERFSNFQWVCRRCGTGQGVFPGYCRACRWPDGSGRNMDVEVHRANRTFYVHSTALLNIPQRHLEGLLSLPEWPAVVAAKFLGFSELRERSLAELGRVSAQDEASSVAVSNTQLEDLMRRHDEGELTPEALVEEMRRIREHRREEGDRSRPSAIVDLVEKRTGVPFDSWRQAGQQLMEAVMPLESGSPVELFDRTEESRCATAILRARELGASKITLVTDFPIITVSYGYTRVEYTPNQCRLNPFPPDGDHAGRLPIFVDQVQADALVIRLNAKRVCGWLESNGVQIRLPKGTDSELVSQAFFVELFSDANLRETLRADRAAERLAFGLLHSLSHLCLRQAALLCGLDRTSLSEYLLPKALTFAVYCNHRFGATIGAFASLFEQSLSEWLDSVRDARYCVYDPVCRDRESSCHACLHLAETSCRFFNLNLGRCLLFGGRDPEVGAIERGYFDMR